MRPMRVRAVVVRPVRVVAVRPVRVRAVRVVVVRPVDVRHVRDEVGVGVVVMRWRVAGVVDVYDGVGGCCHEE